MLLINHSITSSNKAIRLITTNFYQAGTSATIKYEFITPKLAVSKGLSSEATMYIMKFPLVNPVQAILALLASVVLYESTLKKAGGTPLGPVPVFI